MSITYKKVTIIFLLIVVLNICTGCFTDVYSEPLDFDEIDSFFVDYQDSLETVNEYLLSLEYDYLVIKSNNRKMFISQSQEGTVKLNNSIMKITDEAVIDSINELWSAGCSYIAKKTEHNAVYFTLWERGIEPAECGIVYPIDKEKEPEIQYQIELKALSNQDWYYYLADYEDWRLTQ